MGIVLYALIACCSGASVKRALIPNFIAPCLYKDDGNACCTKMDYEDPEKPKCEEFQCFVDLKKGFQVQTGLTGGWCTGCFQEVESTECPDQTETPTDHDGRNFCRLNADKKSDCDELGYTAAQVLARIEENARIA